MPKVIELVKIPLPGTKSDKAKLFYNKGSAYQQAISILICNTSNLYRNVSILFARGVNADLSGSNMSALRMAPNETMVLPDRIIGPGDAIIGWAESENTVYFSADVIEFVQ